MFKSRRNPYPVTPMHALHCSGKGKNACNAKKQSAELAKKGSVSQTAMSPGTGENTSTSNHSILTEDRKNVTLSSRSPLFRPRVDRQHSTVLVQ